MAGPAPSVMAGEAEWRAWLDAILAITDPDTANRAVTRAHYDLSLALAEVIGPGSGANFHTWAVWGSREAGRTIALRDIPGLRGRVALLGSVVGALVGAVLFGPLGGLGAAGLVGAVGAVVTHRELAQARRAIAHGNRIVVDEIGGVTARFVTASAHGGAGWFEAFLGSLRRGPTGAGGQDLLRGAFAAYHRAQEEHDASRRQQLVFAANCLAVWHEHVRLQRDIAAALPSRLRRVITARLLHFSVGPEPLHVGRDLTPVGHDAWAPMLTDLEVPLAIAVVAALRDPRRAPDGLRGSAATDWAVIDQRMNYVVDLFRSRHAMAEVFDLPYPTSSADSVPDGTSVKEPDQAGAVVALDEDARDVGHDRVAEHGGGEPPRVPQEEDRAQRGDRPVRPFGAAGLHQELFEVGAVATSHLLLRKAPSEQRARLREGILPGLDAQDPLVGVAVALEPAQGEDSVAA
ncbi:MAG TPA: hypothetical protein VLV81_01470 [Acidimicrobiia bacterium]|nr:hypothetical protein [Acidimicrobiia bacterium]